jgi:hypothetical protein
MSIINEDLARRSKENMSFSDYKQGSATAEYRAVIADAKQKIEAAKAKVSDEGKERLDNLYSWYCSAYGKWINKSNANGASHVSQMISGASNYNMRAHERYLNRERTLWAEYDEIKDIESKIYSIIRGDKIIKSNDENAVEKLKEKLAKAEEYHQSIKDFNIKARKEKTDQAPAYMLQNSNGRIKAIKDRIERLEKLQVRAAETPQIENEINGIKIVDNLEAQRLQIFFPDIPSKDIREQLKHNGFRWSPSNNCWQSYRGYQYEQRIKKILA